MKTMFEGGFLDQISGSVLIVSTRVGKGNISIGEAICEELILQHKSVNHIMIEDYLPERAVNEDLKRYKFITKYLKFLLHIIYRVDFIYRRKYLREFFNKNLSDYEKLINLIELEKYNLIVTISHRPTFWVSLIKFHGKFTFKLGGVLTEFGPTIAWRHVFWQQVNYFFSPLNKNELDYKFNEKLIFYKIDLPIKNCFKKLGDVQPEKNNILIVAGFWGQISVAALKKLVFQLLSECLDIKIAIVCGLNTELKDALKLTYRKNTDVTIYGEVSDLSELLAKSNAIITKPGMSTILESHFMKRKIFLIKGMPVAEEHNAKYAIQNFSAENFTIDRFKQWFSKNL